MASASKPSFPRFALPVMVLIGGVLFVGGCRGEEKPYQAASTQRMAERLEKIAQSVDPQRNPYANEARVAFMQRQQIDPSDVVGRVRNTFLLGQEFLRAGHNKEAIAAFVEIQQTVERTSLVLPEAVDVQIAEALALAYLRQGEQENCIEMHNAAACLLPLRPEGVHTRPEGARNAYDAYEALLHDQPDRLDARWLLNLSAMALGQYPEQVSEPYRIAPEVWASDYDIAPFQDVAMRLGLHVLGLSGGSSMEDFDGDGDLDIMASSWGFRDHLQYFQNNGDGSFTDKTMSAGLQGMVGGLNILHADYDNDGFRDLFVLRGAWIPDGIPNSLLRNNGDGTFADVTEAAGVFSAFPTQTAAWGDYNNDGWLDLFIGNESLRDVQNACELYRNNGDGTFTNVAADLGVDAIGFVKGVVWGDYDNDGVLDLYISVYGGPNHLFHGDGPEATVPWAFTDVARDAGVQEPIDSFPTWFWDFDNDGDLDLFVSGYRTSTADVAAEYLGFPTQGEPPRLYRNDGDGSFTDIAQGAHLNRMIYAMGSNYGDFDNDGWLDFYAGTGDPAMQTLIPNLAFRNAEGLFFQDVTVSAGLGHLQKGHGVAFGDIDHDGDQDIYAVIGGAFSGDVYHNVLFENPGHGHHWITLRLEGQSSNRDAIGARIKVVVETEQGRRTLYRVVGTGGSFGASSLQQEIGLGQALSISEVEVTWPASGTQQVFGGIAMDQVIMIREGESQPVLVPTQSFKLGGL